MMTPNLAEVKSMVLTVLDEDEDDLEKSPTYLEVKVTGEVVSGIVLAPETAGAGIAIAAKGGVSLKKAIEKLDLAGKYIKKAENAYEQYNIDKEKYEEADNSVE